MYPGQPQNMYPAQPQPQQVVVVNPAGYRCYHRYASNAARNCGILQIICGILVIVSIIAIRVIVAQSTTLYYSYQTWFFIEFWGPASFFLAGGFGIHSSKTKSHCTVTCTMVFSIINAIISGLLIASAAYFFAAVSSVLSSGLTPLGNGIVACYGIILVASIIEFISAITAAALCCHGCSGGSGPAGQQGHMAYYPQGAPPPHVEMGAAAYQQPAYQQPAYQQPAYEQPPSYLPGKPGAYGY